MLPISLNYVQWPISGNPASQVMSIKLKILWFSSQEISWPEPPVNDCRKEEINTSPLEADKNQEMFDFIPSLISIKEAWILTQARWFFGTLVHHLLSLLAFQIKFLAATIHPLIHWSTVHWAVRAWTWEQFHERQSFMSHSV